MAFFTRVGTAAFLGRTACLTGLTGFLSLRVQRRYTADIGGSTSLMDCSKPCMGVSRSALMTAGLCIPEPPNFLSSELNTSAYSP